MKAIRRGSSGRRGAAAGKTVRRKRARVAKRPGRDQALWVRASKAGKVADIMTRHALTVRPDTSLDSVIQLLLEQQISGLPVVDEAGGAVGVISKTDLIRDSYLRKDTDEEESASVRLPARRGIRYSPGPGYHVESGDARTAADVMTPMVLTIREDAPIAEAARKMAAGGIHRMPVVSTDGEIVGVVAAMDVVGWVAGLRT